MLKYISKHTQEWTEFKSEPTRGELISLAKYQYKISRDGKTASIDDLIREIDGKQVKITEVGKVRYRLVKPNK